MKFYSLVFCLVAALFVTACESKPLESDQTTQVDLASDDFLEASFMSKAKSFSYHFEYDGALMQMTEGEALASGPYFLVEGGSTILGETLSLSEIVEMTELAGEPVQVGAYQVYRYMDSQGSCALARSLVPYGEEALLLTLSICEGQDGEKGRMALESLLQNLSIQAQ